jgi:hypothetical protein
MQPTGELDSSGQSVGGDNLAGNSPGTSCIQVVKGENNTCSPLFNLGKSRTDLFVGFSEDEFVKLSLPFIPKPVSLIIQYV